MNGINLCQTLFALGLQAWQDSSAEGRRGESRGFLKGAAEVSVVRETAGVRHIRDGVLRKQEKFEGSAEPDLCQMVAKRASKKAAGTARQMNGVNTDLARDESQG